MKKWTENDAVNCIKKDTNTGTVIRIIRAPNGLNGLKQCSAVDYLVNYCGYLYKRA